MVQASNPSTQEDCTRKVCFECEGKVWGLYIRTTNMCTHREVRLAISVVWAQQSGSQGQNVSVT